MNDPAGDVANDLLEQAAQATASQTSDPAVPWDGGGPVSVEPLMRRKGRVGSFLLSGHLAMC